MNIKHIFHIKNKQNMVNPKASDFVISVNPGATTLGQLHPESANSFMQRAVKSAYEESPSKRMILDLFFGSIAPGVNSYGSLMLLVRFLIGGLLVAAGIFSLSGISTPTSFGTSLTMMGGNVMSWMMTIVVGSMLALGSLTRFASFFAAFSFGGYAVAGMMAGLFPVQDFLLTFISIGFIFSGAGRYSLDFIIRKAIIRNAVARHQRNRNRPITYRAFRQGHC